MVWGLGFGVWFYAVDLDLPEPLIRFQNHVSDGL